MTHVYCVGESPKNWCIAVTRDDSLVLKRRGSLVKVGSGIFIHHKTKNGDISGVTVVKHGACAKDS